LYDLTGNITSKSDVGAYDYSTLQSGCSSYANNQKHAVRNAGGTVYCYDANGNMVRRGVTANTISWTSYNYPSTINSGTETVSFLYGPERQRWRTQLTSGGVTETTYHVGREFQKVQTASTDYRHYIYVGSRSVAIYSRLSTGTNTLRYVLEDHQSSATNLLSSTGTSIVKENFSAFGNRRNPTTWSGAPSAADLTAINGITREGYTWQTALGAMGLNHMNGRVQDSVSGRFISPDPHIPDPLNTQDYNRYSYVKSNPMTLSDPTGFTSRCDAYAGMGGGNNCPFNDDFDFTFLLMMDPCNYTPACGWVGNPTTPFDNGPYGTPSDPNPGNLVPTAGGGGGAMPTGADPMANCTAPTMNTEALRSYSRTEPNYHEFTAYTAIGPDWLMSQSFLNTVFDTWRYGEGLLAPGAPAGIMDGIPALLGSPILFPDQRNWIFTANTNRDARSWTNATLPGHVFHPGRVDNSIQNIDGTWYMVSVGQGITDERFNDTVFGFAAFSTLQQSALAQSSVFSGFLNWEDLVGGAVLGALAPRPDCPR
jgi:RHS repeat-associated protein